MVFFVEKIYPFYVLKFGKMSVVLDSFLGLYDSHIQCGPVPIELFGGVTAGL